MNSPHDPAYPSTHPSGCSVYGLSKREYIAVRVLEALIQRADYSWAEQGRLAERAVLITDGLLEELDHKRAATEALAVLNKEK